MKEIINKFYRLRYDEKENRVYFDCMGNWTSREVTPDFVKDWETIIENCKTGWTIIGDLRKVEYLSDDAQAWHAEAQKKCMENGVRKVAQVAPMETAATCIAFSRQSGMKKVLWAFTKPEDAIEWLDDKISFD